MKPFVLAPFLLMLFVSVSVTAWGGEMDATQKQALLLAAQKTDQVVTSGPSAWLLENQKPLLALYTTPEGRIYLYDAKGNYVSPVNAQEWSVFLLPVISKHHGTAGHGDGGCDSNGHGAKSTAVKEMI